MLVKLVILAVFSAVGLNRIVAVGQLTNSSEIGCHSNPSVQTVQLSWMISSEQESSNFEPEEGEFGTNILISS